MSLKIIAYSYRGNNVKLATALAKEFEAPLTILQETKKRKMMRTMLDIVFHKIPQPINLPEVKDNDHLLLVGPVWGGRPCLLFRSLLHSLASSQATYSYLSISGGNLTQNPKVRDYLLAWTGKEPRQLAIFSLNEVAKKEIPQKQLMSYVVDDQAIEQFTLQLKKQLTSLR